MSERFPYSLQLRLIAAAVAASAAIHAVLCLRVVLLILGTATFGKQIPDPSAWILIWNVVAILIFADLIVLIAVDAGDVAALVAIVGVALIDTVAVVVRSEALKQGVYVTFDFLNVKLLCRNFL